MVELVDTTALEAVAARCEGSSPSLGTREIKKSPKGDLFFYAASSRDSFLFCFGFPPFITASVYLKSSRLSIFLGPENDACVSVISKSRITIIASVTSSRVFMTKSQLRYCHSRNSFSPTSFLHFFQGFCTLCDAHLVFGCEINVSLSASSSERDFFIIKG